jgi:hypothetical protein
VTASAEISGFLNQVFTFYLPIEWLVGRSHDGEWQNGHKRAKHPLRLPVRCATASLKSGARPQFAKRSEAGQTARDLSRSGKGLMISTPTFFMVFARPAALTGLSGEAGCDG